MAWRRSDHQPAARRKTAGRAQTAARRSCATSPQKCWQPKNPIRPGAPPPPSRRDGTDEEVADGSTDRTRVSCGAVEAARAMGGRRQGDRHRVASGVRGSGEYAGADFRSAASGARRLPDAGPGDRRADQCEPYDSALARRPRAPSRMPANNRGVHRRPDGPHAGLHERHLRRLRGTSRRMGGQRQRARRREPGRIPEVTRAQGSLADAHHRSSHDRQGQRRRARAGQRGRAAQGRRHCAWDRRAWRENPRDARAVRRRNRGLSGDAAARGHRRVRAFILRADGHAGTEVHLSRQLLDRSRIASTIRCRAASTSRMRS